ncbi:MAG TPA: hypothetical protein VNL98_12785 [Gemmatimonadales bacterium]|nr:hypothetical protein [Gemmatimonadales bacterium]
MARRRMLLSAVLVFAIAGPLAAQGTRDWQYRWFWGGKAGMLGYDLPTAGTVFVPQFGGEWLITARRTALYLGFSQSLTAEQDSFALSGVQGNQQVAFDRYRRIQIGIVAIIGDGHLQWYAGGGFAIHTLVNARNTGTTTSAAIDNAIANASSVGVAMVMGGVQLRFGRQMALYGHFQGTPGTQDFLLAGASSSIEAGIRMNLLPAREDDMTVRR